MNALKSQANRAKREYTEALKKDMAKHCRKYLEETEADMREIQRLNAVMHVLYLMCVLHDVFGFGKNDFRDFGMLSAKAEKDL